MACERIKGCITEAPLFAKQEKAVNDETLVFLVNTLIHINPHPHVTY